MDEIRDETGRLYIHTIDRSDRIVDVNREWLAFAEENGAPWLNAGSVLSRPLWDFITGMETRHIYRLIITRARERLETAAIPFRCDSPDCRRHMAMELRPIEGGQVEFACTVLKVEKRPYVALLDPKAERSEEFITICSWCRRVRLKDGWSEAEEAVRSLGLFSAEILPQITHGICPDCVKAAAWRRRTKAAS